MLYLLTAETLPVDQLLNTAMPKIVQQGQEIYQKGRAKIEQCEPTTATITIEELTGPAVQAVVRLAGNQVSVTCSCRYGYAWGLCQHRVAALLQLRDHLRMHPPSLWRAVLDQAIQPSARRVTHVSTSGAALIFSLQKRGAAWSILPYSIAGKHLPVDHRGDPDVLAEAITSRALYASAKALRSQVSPDLYPSMPVELLDAANTAISSGAA